MSEEKTNPIDHSFMKSLKKRLTERREWAKEEGCTAYRLFDREHNVPLTLDIFNHKYLVVIGYFDKAEDENFNVEHYLSLISRALAIPSNRIFYKERNKLQNRQQYTKQNDQNFTLWVEEDGLQFKLNLSDYLDNGLFLDGRLNRYLVRESSEGRRVLNLFCYTGGFSVYAAVAGASLVKSVDISNTYLEWAKENMSQNGLMGGHIHWVQQDVLQFLVDEAKTPNRYDLIILDPPIFSNSHKMAGTLDIKRDHSSLINQTLKLLTQDGLLLFSTPLSGFQLKKEFIKGKVKDITKDSIPYDFRRSKPHYTFLIGSAYDPKKNRP